MSSNAQVFISCGQREDLGELETAQKIAEALVEYGFQPYIATSQQTLRGLKENIFNKLAESEYFVFVDFVREKLDIENETVHRGSVFSQQELALASYLDIEVIAFQEVNLKPLEGILRFMQTNCLPFDDRAKLPEMVIDTLREREWSSTWKNSLNINHDVSILRNLIVNNLQNKPKGDFYHILVKNNHVHKVARNVYGYLEKVIDVNTGEELVYGSVEFKWAGYMMPNAIILPRRSRKLDAFWIPHEQPNNPKFNCFTDSTSYIPQIQGPGQWYLDYSVFSDTVLGSSMRFLLTLDGTLRGITLEPVV